MGEPIKDRIRAHYRPGIDYWDLLHAVFPRIEYPRAWEYSSNGGPPGCAMAFGRALREMGGDYGPDPERIVYIPPRREQREEAS